MTGRIIDISAVDYHANRSPIPPFSLSSSVASILLSESPAHALAAYKAGTDGEDDDDPKFDLGTACHRLILEGNDGFLVVDAPDWRTKAAKEQRDAARAIGAIPLLAHKMALVEEMARALKVRLFAFREQPPPFTMGKPEQTIIWTEDTPHGPINCKARVDWLSDDFTHAFDLKTTEGSANPDAWIRQQLYRRSLDVQASLYLRGVKAATGVDAQWRFVVAESRRPFGVSVVGLSPAALAHADDKCQQAINQWAACHKSGQFPMYPQSTCYADVPAYEVARWEEQMSRDEGTDR